MNISNDRLAELIDMMPRNAEWQAEVVAALRELSRLRGQPCCKGLAPPDECKCLRGPTPAVDALIAKYKTVPSVALDEVFECARTLERKCAAQREALESIRIFARDCIDTGHDRGALGNLYAIVDLCDRIAALSGDDA